MNLLCKSKVNPLLPLLLLTQKLDQTHTDTVEVSSNKKKFTELKYTKRFNVAKADWKLGTD